MKAPVEARCIVCPLSFCCANCRWVHEQKAHGLTYNCCLCRGLRYLCRPQDFKNQDFIKHLAEEHLPLQCRKCDHVFTNMEEFASIKNCTSLSELLEKSQNRDPIEIDARFDSLYEKEVVKSVVENVEGGNMEAIISINKSNRTAVITPIIRQKHLVDYDESTEESEYDSPHIQTVQTPYPKHVPKTPQLRKQRAGTPHVKKFRNLMRQTVVEEYEKENDKAKVIEDSPGGSKTSPNRNDGHLVAEPAKEMTTPTSQMTEHFLKMAQIVTTSTPTHPAVGAWSIFPEQGADSPLSEIEGTRTDSMDNEPSKSESSAPKLKSIIVTGSRIKLGSQDSSEKQVTFQDSPADNTNGSGVKTKKVKFAEDTVFEQEQKVKRVFRKPKRMLTPGPQKPSRFCFNPRFQALINRFENKGITPARTPVNSYGDKEIGQESTPPLGGHANMPARAINFKEDSPVICTDLEKESNDLFDTCIESPTVSSAVVLNTAITTLTTNIAGTLQNCLSSALETNEDETEIQFKFVITKRKVTRMMDQVVEQRAIEEGNERDKENIWSTVARAVKNVFWGDKSMNLATNTPVSAHSYNSTNSVGSKRKSDDLSDNELSPLNHKRHKYSGRIRGRPPLPRASWGVAALRSSHSAEQHSLVKKLSKSDDTMNQSF